MLRANRFHGRHFRRQHRIGPFIVDFCCIKERLIIEIDGEKHAYSITEDRERTAFLSEKGFRVVRFWNEEVLREMDRVLMMIKWMLPPRPAAPQ
ncbi:MAG: DUF559 domain-containing protein [Elusimicrobiota bacterium]